MTHGEKVLLGLLAFCMVLFIFASAFIAENEYEHGVRDAYSNTTVIDTLSNGKTVIVRLKRGN